MTGDEEVLDSPTEWVAKRQPAAPTGDERERLWQLMTSLWPDYGRYQSKSSRQIPVVILQPTTDTEPPPRR
ncbi:nitroreductase/quinone reductase family protein [Micromonospora citrea]|uniref:nitroreductase/quinone reductase family protein n=1 Tax=Micromonospora citrea TaxID=47855 RepID=UPI003C5F9D35